MATIAVTAMSFLKNQELVAYLKETLARHDLRLRADPEGVLKGKELAAFLAGADAALIGREPITDELLAPHPKLKALSLYGVGFDNVDLEACARHGVEFLYTPGVNADAVAEHTVGLMLAVLRNIAYTDRLLHAGKWLKNGGRTLTGKTVGIVGCGAIGSRLARLLKAFQCELVLCDIVDKSALARETSGKLASFKETLETADIISMHVPLTPVTRGMIGEASLGQMRKGSVLINTSRGPVVQLAALRKALESGHLAGAGLDVFETEPMLDPAICSLPQLVGTPHIAGNAREAVWAMGQAAVDNLARHFGP